MHQECWRLMVFLGGADRGWGAGSNWEEKKGRTGGGDLGIVFVLSPQYNAPLENDSGSSLERQKWMA